MSARYHIPPYVAPVDAHFDLEGALGAYLHAVTTQWLLVAPEANPGMLTMLRDRDRQPFLDIVPWAGEFAGKYLTAATQVWRVTGDPVLRQYLAGFVAELVSLQAEDGYLGPWPRACRLTNAFASTDGQAYETWDSWGHYHAMLGLLRWYESTKDQAALDCACRIGDLLCRKYLGQVSPRLVDTGSTEMNLAPAHGLCQLYRQTGTASYLALARQLVDEEFDARNDSGEWLAGHWLHGALAGQEFYQLPKQRWESLHPIMALAELYWLTGEERYREAFSRIWWSIVRLERHNNGGFSSDERGQGNPYHQGAIETCCTIAWTALSVEMYRLTGDPYVADELELTLWNSIIGMHSYSGRWATYNTPMDGVRRASAEQIVFQARAGTPELNCCSVNSTRGFGMISDWAVVRDHTGVLLNLYAPGSITMTLPSTTALELAVQTDYPREGRVTITVTPAQAEAFTLSLRIPRWSVRTHVRVNGQPVENIVAGRYLPLARSWAPGDVITLELDLSLHCWHGAQECAGKTALYRGPILLTYDRRFNEIDPPDLPALDAHALTGTPTEWPGRIPTILLLAFPATDGRTVNLCDFGSAGEGGSPYCSWLSLTHTDAGLPQFFSPCEHDDLRATDPRPSHEVC